MYKKILKDLKKLSIYFGRFCANKKSCIYLFLVIGFTLILIRYVEIEQKYTTRFLAGYTLLAI